MRVRCNDRAEWRHTDADLKNAFKLTSPGEPGQEDALVFYTSLPEEKQAWATLLRECIASSLARFSGPSQEQQQQRGGTPVGERRVGSMADMPLSSMAGSTALLSLTSSDPGSSSLRARSRSGESTSSSSSRGTHRERSHDKERDSKVPRPRLMAARHTRNALNVTRNRMSATRTETATATAIVAIRSRRTEIATETGIARSHRSETEGNRKTGTETETESETGGGPRIVTTREPEAIRVPPLRASRTASGRIPRLRHHRRRLRHRLVRSHRVERCPRLC